MYLTRNADRVTVKVESKESFKAISIKLFNLLSYHDVKITENDEDENSVYVDFSISYFDESEYEKKLDLILNALKALSYKLLD